ncbi:hypothetical protein [Roseateles puraquae]|nr:hypothetical protein [Roseateles puraquae]MDG0854782.1 hypothetical protein [Roseateles puraquae]
MHPLEGAYTRTAKIALVNALDSRALGELLYGSRLLPNSFGPVHGRSFLYGAWAASRAQGGTGQSALPGFLSSLCGGWATVIASDARLRFCQSCADVGYQSALFQIDALSRCPLHGERLRDTCPHCDAPTPRYALTVEGFQSPMQCTACGGGYASAWDGTACFERWGGPLDVRPLQRLARRLQAWESLAVQWPTVSSWIDTPSPDAAGRQRVHVFQALGMLSGLAVLDHGQDSRVSQVKSSCVPCQRPPPRQRERVAIYKSIRRHIMRRLGLAGRGNRFTFSEVFYRQRVNEAVVPRRSSCPAPLHALVIWISRCEARPPAPLLQGLWPLAPDADEPRVRLRTPLLLWPIDVQVSDNVWGHFVWRSFLEDLWTARQWQAAVRPLGEPFDQADREAPEVKANRATFLELLTAWTPRLSPLMETFSSGLSHFTWEEGRGQRQLCLVWTRRFEGAWHDESGTAGPE